MLPIVTSSTTMKLTVKNTKKLMKKFPIQCDKCGKQIMEDSLEDDCSKCGFSNYTSVLEWILERQDMKE